MFSFYWNVSFRPYVDTSDDEDYFLPEDPSRKNQM